MNEKKIVRWWQDWIDKQGDDKFIFNSDEDVVMDVAKGVLDNERKKGFKYCPCRLPIGDVKKDLGLVCPCNFKIQKTWKEKGECWCSLFVKK